MTQTLALFIDAYRELNARKMFWITLILSGVVVSTLLIIGVVDNPESTTSFDSQHIKVMFWETPIPLPLGMRLAYMGSCDSCSNFYGWDFSRFFKCRCYRSCFTQANWTFTNFSN